MSYIPYLIANQETGIDRSVQPWLAPDDSYQELFDGYVYRGQTKKRDGYSGYATGVPEFSVESRMVHKLSSVAPATGVIDGANKTFTFTLTTPVARGSVQIVGNNPAQTMNDNKVGAFTGDGTGSINYTSGAVSITFTTAPAMASTVLLSYNYYPGYPVMGIMRFYPTDNDVKMLTVDTHFVNIYDSATNLLVDISPGTPYTGTSQDFFSWVNYQSATSVNRLLFCNGAAGDVIQQYSGTTVINYVYTSASITALNARQLFNFKDRLILFQTYETTGAGQVFYPRRIRISGTGTDCDKFDTSATGAGFIDIPDNTWFFGAAQNRDDILFFTEAATWALKYTGNDVVPFALQKLDGSRGSKAAFSVISYLNRTLAGSPRGLILCDGYTVDRFDDKIPYYSFENINSDYFESCYSGFIDQDRDVYLLYPSLDSNRPELVADSSSDQILTINFEEDNFAVYRIPLSCVGNYIISNNLNWNDLLAFDTWDQMAKVYGTWNDFPFTKDSPIMIGGGHKGEIWAMNDTESEDNPQNVRAITIIDDHTIEVTTDWNNYIVGDNITFQGVGGMTEINYKQGQIISPLTTQYTTFRIVFTFPIVNAYTSGGSAARCIPFIALTKKFNPFLLKSMDKKVKCGWCYFYVDVTTTNLTHNEVDEDGNITEVTDTPFITLEVFTNDNTTPSIPSFTYQIDCSSETNETKKWVKIWINQTAKFVQFRLTNNQAGAKIALQAIMPGFQPVGRLV